MADVVPWESHPVVEPSGWNGMVTKDAREASITRRQVVSLGIWGQELFGDPGGSSALETPGIPLHRLLSRERTSLNSNSEIWNKPELYSNKHYMLMLYMHYMHVYGLYAFSVIIVVIIKNQVV